MQAYIVSSVRTAIGKAPHGALHHVRPDDLGAIALKGALAKVPALSGDLIEDVIMGCAMPEAEQGYNIGRVIAQRAGLPDSVAGATINRLCSSGLQSISMAHQAITLGQSAAIIAGGNRIHESHSDGRARSVAQSSLNGALSSGVLHDGANG